MIMKSKLAPVCGSVTEAVADHLTWQRLRNQQENLPLPPALKVFCFIFFSFICYAFTMFFSCPSGHPSIVGLSTPVSPNAKSHYFLLGEGTSQ